MSEFNEQLLRDLPEEKWTLAKLILFCVKEGINPTDFFEVEDGKFILLDDHHAALLTIVETLRKETKVIVADYAEGRGVRLNTPVSLYSKGQTYQTDEYDVEGVRQLWLFDSIGERGMAGDALAAKTRLELVLEKYEPFTPEEFKAACELYIKYCRDNPNFYITHFDNFIYSPQKDKSTLMTWITEVRHSKQKKSIIRKDELL